MSSWSYKRCAAEVKEYIRSSEKTEAGLNDLADEFVKLTVSEAHKVKYSPSTYAHSKMLIRALVEVQAKRWPVAEHFSCCPGWVQTNMGGQKAAKTPEQGANVPYWLATVDKDATRPSGSYWAGERELRRWPLKVLVTGSNQGIGFNVARMFGKSEGQCQD